MVINMKTDIQIAQEAVLAPIQDVAAKLDITADELELYGKCKAKLSTELWDKVKNNPDGKLILVTAINPTPAGINMTGMISIRNLPASRTDSNLTIPVIKARNRRTMP